MVIAETLAAEASIHTVKKLIDLVIDHAQKYHKFQKESLRDISDILERYLKKCYDSSNSMSTIVFRNQPKTIDELYIPLTISQECFPPDDDTEKYTLNFGNIEYIEKYPLLKIVDTAGMGKSTIVMFIAMQVIKEEKYVPVIIELRKMSQETDILSFIMEQMSFLDEKFSHQDVLDLIKGGDFLFLFDGYDEIPEMYKTQVTEKVQDFLKKIDDNHVIISSRKEGGLDCFDGFQTFSIVPLEEEEAYELIRKYDNYGDRAEELIQAIKNDSNLTLLQEFLTNPLMVSLLYKAYSYKPDIPYKKYVFYDQVYAALFEEHDLTKGGAYKRPKKCGLDMADFKRVLNRLGFYCARKNIVEFTREELLTVLRDIVEKMPDLSIKPVDFQHDLVTTVPLFVYESGKYRWVHKSFYEYFAACFIRYDVREKQEQIISKMANRENISKFENILDFCYDMDTRLVQQTVVLPFLEKYIEHCETSYQFLTSKLSKKNQLKISLLKGISYFINWGFIVSDIGANDLEEKARSIESLCLGHYRTSNGNYATVTFSFKKGYDIVSLLFMKGANIFSSRQIKLKENEPPRFGNVSAGIYSVEDNVSNSSVIKKLLFEDDELFSRIFHYSYVFKFVLDYDKCIALRDKIKENIKIEKEYLDDLDI